MSNTPSQDAAVDKAVTTFFGVARILMGTDPKPEQK